MIVKLNGNSIADTRCALHRFLEQTKGLQRAHGRITPRQQKIERQRMRAKIRMTKVLRRKLEDAMSEIHAKLLERLPQGAAREDAYSDLRARVEDALSLMSPLAIADALEQAIQEAFQDGIADALDEVKTQVSFDIAQTRALDALKTMQMRFALDIVESQQNAIRRVIANGVDQGLVHSVIAADVRDAVANDVVYYLNPDMEIVRAVPVDTWAEMVARTEVARAQNQGIIETYRAAGNVGQVVFIATNDDVTCPICEALDGQEMQMDSDDVPPVHPSCRCTVVSAEAYARGAGGAAGDEEENAA